MDAARKVELGMKRMLGDQGGSMVDLMGTDRSARQTIYRFANGYGASVINDGYGSQAGLKELAVLELVEGEKFELTYETPITDDVLGHLTDEDVDRALKDIEALPARQEAG